MAQGKKAIKLGNSPAAPTPDPTPITPIAAQVQDTTTVADIQSVLDDPNIVNPATVAPLPVEDEPDEDLQVNRQSSVKDKKVFYTNKTRVAGRAYAEGINSTNTFSDNLLEGTVNDAFTYAEYPNGTKQDDAEEQYKIFRMPNKNSKPVDTTSGDFNSNVKKFRNIVFLGMKHRAGAQKWFADVRESYEKHMAIPEDRKSMKNFRGTFEASLDIVREQLYRDGQAPSGIAPLMSDDEVFEAMRKKDQSATDTALELLVDAYKNLLLAKDGKDANKKTGKGGFTGIKDQELTDIIQSLQDYAFNTLDAVRAQTFKAKTTKQKRSRRVIKAPGSSVPDEQEIEEVQEQADSE